MNPPTDEEVFNHSEDMHQLLTDLNWSYVETKKEDVMAIYLSIFCGDLDVYGNYADEVLRQTSLQSCKVIHFNSKLNPKFNKTKIQELRKARNLRLYQRKLEYKNTKRLRRDNGSV